MTWTTAKKYKDANHAPIVKLKGAEEVTVKSGEKVELNASKSYDPDGNKISFNWWNYKDAGTYDGLVTLQNTDKKTLSSVAPKVNKMETIHVILEVKDNALPALVSYKRIIITVKP